MSQKILAELRKRADKKQFLLADYCFDKQLKFISDSARYKTAVCSRRAGKSASCAGDMIETAKSGPFNNVAYITLSRTSAERIIWPILKQLVEEFKIDCKIDNTKLTMEFKGGSTIYLTGAKDRSEIQKIRGLSLKKAYIDEAQSFKESTITELIDDILAYCIMDVNGTICLIGTPGPLSSGYFYNACHSEGWSNHKWTIFDNPWIKRKSGKEPAELLAEERKRKGVDESNPTYRREALGEWVTDYDALVYKFSADKNLYRTLPQGKMEYIFGIDIGYNDADAIAVMGYSYEDKHVYLIEEEVTKKQDITSLANKIKALKEKYKPIRMVMDAGALGKKIQEELRLRQGLLLDAAEKTRKFEFIELLNDDLRNGRFKAYYGSQFEEDAYKTEWDRENPNKLKISDRYHTDIGDAILYAWRECRHYFYEPTEKAPLKDSEAYMRALEEKEADEMERLQKRGDHELAVEDAEFIYAEDFDD